MDMVEIGDVAPDFTLKDQDKNEVTLSSFAGSRVILSFYPAALLEYARIRHVQSMISIALSDQLMFKC